MDLTKLSDADLLALQAGDLTKVSDSGLAVLSETSPTKAAQKTHPDELDRQVYAEQQRQRDPTVRFLGNLAGGMTGLLRGGANLASDGLGERIWPTEGSVDKTSAGYLTGSLLDPVAYATGLGGMQAANLFTKAPVIGKSLANVGAQGVIGGGVGGAAAGALSEDSTAYGGGVVGALLGGFIPAAAKIGGYAIDRIGGTYPALRAKEIISKAYGDSLDAARQFWQNASPELTATQAAAPTRSTTGAALGQRAEKMLSQPYADIAEAQRVAALQELQSVSGGSTQQAAKDARKLALEKLRGETMPMMETELQAANTARDVMGRLEPRIAAKQGSIEQALQGQGKTATEAAQSTVRFQAGKPGWISNADRAQEWKATAADFGIIKNQRQSERDFLQGQIDSLQAHGLEPIDTGSLVGRIETGLNDPSMAGNTLAQKALKEVAKQLKEWTEKGSGIIDANALYSIRKNAVQASIQKQLRGSDPATQAKATAGVLAKIEPAIDDAIVAAGGTGWRDYLATYASGANKINQMKLGAKAMELYDKNPKALLDLVENNSPDVVQKIFKSKSDIVEAMDQAYVPLSKVASATRRDMELADRALKGSEELTQILKSSSARAWLPRFIDWKLGLAREALDVVEGQLNKATMNKVYAGLQSGKSAEEIMKAVPARERMTFLNLLYNGKATPLTTSAAVQMGAQR